MFDFDFGKSGQGGGGGDEKISFPLPLPPPSSRLSTTPLVEISISPQHSSALRIQDSDPHNLRRTT